MTDATRHGARLATTVTVVVLGLLFAAPYPAEVSEPEPPEVLRKQLELALTDGDLDRSAKLAEKIAFAELVEYLDAGYELVRIHCQRGDTEQAMAAVTSLLEAGYWDYRKLLSDEDLSLINTTDTLRDLVRSAWSEKYLSMLDRPSRDAMQRPEDVMQRLAVRPGELIADIGAGSGYFTVRLAHATGRFGTVIATDTRETMLDHIRRRLEAEQISNVELVQVQPTETGLPAGTVDLVLMVDVMHYIADRAAYAESLREALAPAGRVAIIDFRYDPDAEREFAPPPEQQVPRRVLDEEMASAGFQVAAAYDFLPEQYFVIYELGE